MRVILGSLWCADNINVILILVLMIVDSGPHLLSSVLGAFTSFVWFNPHDDPVSWSHYNLRFTNEATDQEVNRQTKSYQRVGRELVMVLMFSPLLSCFVLMAVLTL